MISEDLRSQGIENPLLLKAQNIKDSDKIRKIEG
jgi:hypothetical protein